MKVSLCITTFNEEKSIAKLLGSILSQTKVPDEIVIVDGGSTDKTLSEIFNFQFTIFRQHPNIKFKLIKNKKRISIARGRNLAVKNAKHSVIAMTDAGCICEKHWLEEMLSLFQHSRRTKRDIVAGFYKMTGKSSFQKALRPFLGIMPQAFDEKAFLPSTRSIAFDKDVWRKVGGFNEKLDKAGEDTCFNLQLSNFNFQIKRNRNAIVYWEVPDNLIAACKKFFYYARGDAQTGDWRAPHNMHAVMLIGRYIVGMVYVVYSIRYQISFYPVFIFILFYWLWAFSKAYKYEREWKVGLWSIIIQIGSDFSVMVGFFLGISWAIQNK